MARVRPAAAALAAVLGAAACAPTYTTHGFTPQMAALDSVSAGLDTRSSVLAKLGRPSASGSFDSDSWYYVASKMERNMFYAPKVVERTVVAIRFDEAGLVQSVDRFGLEDGKVIDLRTETTPTYGRELTVLQQIFGNVGRVDPGQIIGN